VALLAAAVGIPYEKIDPIHLDARLITKTLSRPFARGNSVLPLRKSGSRLTVAVENPFDHELIHTLQSLTGSEVEIVLSARSDIQRYVAEIYGFSSSLRAAAQDLTSGPDLGNLEQFVRLKSMDEIEATDKHVVNAVDYILRYAFDQQASDIHIEPKREHAIVRCASTACCTRAPRPQGGPPGHRLAAQDHGAHGHRREAQAPGRAHQDGIRQDRDRAAALDLPVAFGEKLVIRIFDPQVLLRNLAD
jgi:general secretion pathway protein E